MTNVNIVVLICVNLILLINGAYIDVTIPEQYCTVLRQEDFVSDSGTVGAYGPSQFIGLFFMTVKQNTPLLFEIQTTLWHQITFAVQAEIRGPAAVGKVNNAGLPIVLARSIDNDIDPVNCPIQSTYVVGPTFIDNLRNGLEYVQIWSNATSGEIRGQLQSRRDSLVNFMSTNPNHALFSAELGMSILYMSPPQVPQPGRVGLTHWILTRYPVGQFTALNYQQNFIPILPLGNLTQQVYSVQLVITESPSTVDSVLYSNVVGSGLILYGPGSSVMALSLAIPNQTVIIFNQYVRLMNYQDIKYVNHTNHTGASSTSKPSLVLIIVLLLGHLIL